jgi:capsular exopolysaccharide synthesis family protein
VSRIQQILDKAAREGTIGNGHAAETVIAAGATVLQSEPIFAQPAAAVARPAPAVALPSVSTVRVLHSAGFDRHLRGSMADGDIAEQYRAVRTRIGHAGHHAVSIVLVTSPGRGEGKSLTVANLGLSMAQDYQRRICIVDADLRSPRIHRLFGVPGGPGLSEVLAGDALLEDALVTLEEAAITILPAGEVARHPAELLGTTTMRQTLEKLRSQYDRVLVDTPAAAPLADVGILAPLVDSIVLVVRAGVTSRPAIHEAIAALERDKLLGIVLNEAA